MEVVGQLLINIIFTGGGYALLSIGFNLFYKTRKFIDISYGTLITLGGYLMFLFRGELGLRFLPALFFSMASTAIFALLLDIFVYNQFAKKKSQSLIPLIASLGIYTAMTAVLATIFTSQHQTLNTGGGKVFSILGGQVSLVNVLLTSSAIFASVLILYILKSTKYGKGVRAVDDDKEVSEISGIPTRKIILKTVTLGSVFASMVGIFIVYDVGILPVIGMHYLLRTFIVSVMGGLGSVSGGIISALILSIVETLVAFFLSTAWIDPIVFVLLLGILLLRPNGIFSRPQKN